MFYNISYKNYNIRSLKIYCRSLSISTDSNINYKLYIYIYIPPVYGIRKESVCKNTEQARRTPLGEKIICLPGEK